MPNDNANNNSKEFYDSIARHYNHIFPLKQPPVAFIKKMANPPGSLLDIGCATGEMARELTTQGFEVTGVDLDESMIAVAKTQCNAKFEVLDMMDICHRFGEQSFDTIICLGNTLVHLQDPVKMLSFIKIAKACLAANGKLIFQIINYDRINKENAKSLPTIDNDKIYFERNYKKRHDGKIDFNTRLTIKETGLVIENSIPLYPLKKHQLEDILTNAGFNKQLYYGSFKADPFTEISYPLIVVASKDSH